MSIRRKVTILFLVSLLVMGFIAWWAERSNLRKSLTIQKERYLKEAGELFTLLSSADDRGLQKRLEALGLVAVTPPDPPADARLLLQRPHSFGELRLYRRGQKLYLYLRYLDRKLLLYDTAQESGISERYITYGLIGLDIALLVIFYLLIWRMLSPLHRIASKMSRFAAGELSIRARIDSRDEIGEVARSFNTMAERLTEALRSREELLRDVGHELRTPIAKGRFALDALPDSEAIELIARTFADLERLTGEILQMQMLENAASLHRERFRVSTLITEALGRLYVEEHCIEVELEEDFEIEGDPHYLAVALKNLIDNALKYRKERRPVRIVAGKGRLEVCNRADPLRGDLEHYLKAFTRERRDRSGFGIGLNLVHKILTLHGFSLSYRHEAGENCFTVDFHPATQD